MALLPSRATGGLPCQPRGRSKAAPGQRGSALGDYGTEADTYAEDDVEQSESNQIDYGNGWCEAEGLAVNCGDQQCAWDCSAPGPCEASCAASIDESLSFTITGARSDSAADVAADCYLGDFAYDRDQLLTVDYRRDDGTTVSIVLLSTFGAGDYNADGSGTIGTVIASYTEPDGRRFSSSLCGVSLAAREDGGLQTTGGHFTCTMWDGQLGEGETEFIELEAEFSCSGAALWYRSQ